jgi:hypothetical protein
MTTNARGTVRHQAGEDVMPSPYCISFPHHPEYTDVVDPIEPELDYYRKVEDFFASLRGVPHVLSPKDFQLLRTWWRDQVPLSAVVAGLTEVFNRVREDPQANPVTSLAYCRHAVARQARRLAAMHVGATKPDTGAVGEPGAAAVDHLISALARASAAVRERFPAAAEVIERVAHQITVAGDELPPALLDEHLFGLESGLLRDCWEALPSERRDAIGRDIDRATRSSAASDEALERSRRALRDREVRRLLTLPRLELEG